MNNIGKINWELKREESDIKKTLLLLLPLLFIMNCDEKGGDEVALSLRLLLDILDIKNP